MKKIIFFMWLCGLIFVLAGCSSNKYSLGELLGESYSVDKIERLEIVDKPYSSQLKVLKEDNDINAFIDVIADKYFIKKEKEFIENNYNFSNSCVTYIYFENGDIVLIYSENNKYLIKISDQYYLTK